MDPRTPPSTPRQHVATPHAASPATATEAQQYNEAMDAISRMVLESKPLKTPRSCRSVWQAHGGGIAAPQTNKRESISLPTKRAASSVIESSTTKRKISISPRHLDRNSKPNAE